MKTGIKLIAEERQRQIVEEGFTTEHDIEHRDGELANAAACYALTDESKQFMDEKWGNDQWLNLWPFDLDSFKRSQQDRISDLKKAGALIAAEIDRLLYDKGQLPPDALDLTEKDLVSFGNYLLSERRRESFKAVKIKGIPLNKRINEVHGADIANWKEENK